MRALSLIIVALTLLILAACSGTPTARSDMPLTPEPEIVPDFAALKLPSPRDLPVREATGVLEQITGGSFNLDPYPSHNLDTNGSAAVFEGDWDPDGPAPRDPAYVTYDFSLTGGVPYSLELGWADETPAVWAGLANYDTNKWEWFQAGGPVLLPPGLDAYLDLTNQLLVIIVVTDLGDFQLDWLRINDDQGVIKTNLFFLHHSTGEGIINGGVRDHISDYNEANGTAFEFWDHGYNDDGLLDGEGAPAGCYEIPGDNTDPDGLHYLWRSDEMDAGACRSAIISNHQVVAFKSCFPASDIVDAAQLQEYKNWYLDMLNFFDVRPDIVFVVMSTPPLHPEHTNADNAVRARQFADWLQSGDYLDGHPNVACFDLFDQLASDGGDGPANMLRITYRQEWVDSHPNEQANQTIAPLFAQFLIDAGLAH